jgi:ABC-type nickel/cobalt efflux system permease component RcnA
LALTALLVAVPPVLFAAPASAHPTDEVIQQVYLTPAVSGLDVRLDLTPGVLVSGQFAATVDTDESGALSPAEIDAHVAAVQSAVTAQVDGRPVDLTVASHTYPPVDLLAAAGGTISLEWTGQLPADAHQVVFTDRYDSGTRSTVQMSVLVAPDAVELGHIGHDDGGRSMTVALNPSTLNAGTVPGPEAVAAAPAAAGASMLDALRHPLKSPWALLALVGACCLLGALHALTPGHGKTLLAAYLVGDRGTPRQAVMLGTVITFTHTAAVFALGGAVLLAGDQAVPGAVVPVLTAVAGVVVLVLGVRLVRRRWRTAPSAHDHHHDDHGRTHDEYRHDEHGHGHGSVVTRPPSLRSLATVGLSAGMIPCPEALSVLLLAVGLHRTGLGLVMIVAFSVGLAAVLVGLGLLLVTAAPVLSRVADRRSGWVTARLPLLSAVVVAILGGAMTVTGIGALTG